MSDVPVWVSVILSLAALVTALGILWSKVARPLIRGAAEAEVMYPMMRELTLKFRDVPAVFDILKEIVAQVRTDSGSSLLDTVNQLEVSVGEVRDALEKMEVRTLSAASFLQVGLEADRKLDERDREQVSRLLREQDRLMDRMAAFESRAAGIATDLAHAQTAVEGVASDLASAHGRADGAEGPPGSAGDAALRTGE